MKVIVTGGAGFIGTHLVEELIFMDSEVHVIDNFYTGSSRNVHPRAIIHIADIRSQKAKNIVKKIKPDYIFHLAAQADVNTSIHSPSNDASINVYGTINMLEASREANVKKFIFASTSAVYGDLQKEIITENDITEPKSFYGLSKLTAESYINMYYQYFNLQYTILRYGNVYGPRQLANGEGGVIAIFLDKLKNNEGITVFGDGEQTRDFIHVKDIVRANLAALDKGNQEIIQVGTGKYTSLNELINILEGIHGKNINTIYKNAKSGDIDHSCLCNKKAANILDFVPIYSIKDGLEYTYALELNKS